MDPLILAAGNVKSLSSGENRHGLLRQSGYFQVENWWLARPYASKGGAVKANYRGFEPHVSGGQQNAKCGNIVETDESLNFCLLL